MDELEKNIPDAFWQKAFDGAAETPPARVWDAIERELDKSAGSRILPLWGKSLVNSRPLLWSTGIAASFILLLAGWWLLRTPAHTTSNRSQLSFSRKEVNTRVAEKHPSLPLTPAAEQPADLASAAVPKATTIHNHLHTKAFSPAFEARSTTTPVTHAANDQRGLVEVVAMPLPSRSTQLAAISVQQSNNRDQASYTASQVVSAVYTQSIHAVPVDRLSFDQYASLPMRLGGARPIQRIVWARPLELPAEPASSKTKRAHKELWASVGVLSAAFNPMVSIRSPYAASLNSLSRSIPTASVSSQPNFSIAYQASAGIQLTDHWSVETGVGYLTGRSTVDSPVQLVLTPIQSIANKDLTTSNVYVDALKNSVQLVGGQAASIANNSYVAGNTSSQQQLIANNYQYVQMPVQVGYQLRPRKRFGLALLGGLLTNIFVKNTVADEVVITAKDGVYRPLSFAALMGARLRYRPSQQWSASVAGVYQSTLGLGSQTDSQVQIHPTAAGMSFGVDYHF